ncbi:MAG: hypothetical protein A2X49_07935 [Lentisphaerae bacterium GWF2_52_8]|nr:MAG: hypothetical protein A2X49_07935 [Lentisphaerae bacterium GWF2_52_8]
MDGKIMLVINPGAGRGVQMPHLLKRFFGMRARRQYCRSPEEYLRVIKGHFEKFGVMVEAQITLERGHASKIASKCAEEGYRAVIAAGGDGTVNEVLNGLAGTQTALGVIPIGTANVFAIQTGIPAEIEDACRVIAAAHSIKIDLGRVAGRYFACMCGIGFDAHVLKVADSKFKKTFGAIGYALAGMRQYFRYKFRPMRLIADGEEICSKGRFVIVCNGKYYGGGMVLAEKADHADGKLDVCILKKSDPFSMASYIFRIWSGRLRLSSSASSQQCRQLRIEGGRFAVHADAEYLGKMNGIAVDISPLALNVLCPCDNILSSNQGSLSL